MVKKPLTSTELAEQYGWSLTYELVALEKFFEDYFTEGPQGAYKNLKECSNSEKACTCANAFINDMNELGFNNAHKQDADEKLKTTPTAQAQIYEDFYQDYYQHKDFDQAYKKAWNSIQNHPTLKDDITFQENFVKDTNEVRPKEKKGADKVAINSQDEGLLFTISRNPGDKYLDHKSEYQIKSLIEKHLTELFVQHGPENLSPEERRKQVDVSLEAQSLYKNKTVPLSCLLAVEDCNTIAQEASQEIKSTAELEKTTARYNQQSPELPIILSAEEDVKIIESAKKAPTKYTPTQKVNITRELIQKIGVIQNAKAPEDQKALAYEKVFDKAISQSKNMRDENLTLVLEQAQAAKDKNPMYCTTLLNDTYKTVKKFDENKHAKDINEETKMLLKGKLCQTVKQGLNEINTKQDAIKIIKGRQHSLRTALYAAGVTESIGPGFMKGRKSPFKNDVDDVLTKTSWKAGALDNINSNKPGPKHGQGGGPELRMN